MIIGICLGRSPGQILGVSRCSSFVKSNVSLGIWRGGDSATDFEDFDDAGNSFKTESIISGDIMIGTCLGFRLLKPASFMECRFVVYIGEGKSSDVAAS